MSKKTNRKSPCDSQWVDEFDYSGLSPEFQKLSKPAQRALIGDGIKTPQALARRTRAEVLALHGIGPSSVPVLESALKSAGLKWKSDRSKGE